MLKHETAKSSEFLIAKGRLEVIIEFIDRREGLHDEILFVELLDKAVIVNIKLVFDFANDLFQYVFDRHGATNTAVFIDDDSHVLAGFTKLA